MDHRRRVTCCWAWAVCILWIAAADEPLSIPKVLTGMADSPTSTTVPHSTANTTTGSRVFDDASGAPALSTTASVSVASTVSAQVPTPPPGQVMPPEAPLALSTSSHVPSSPVAPTTSQRPTGPSPALGTTRGEVPPAPPSRLSTLVTPTTSSRSSAHPPVKVKPAEEKNRGAPVEPNTKPKTAPEPPPPCDYNPCVHLQRPCPELKHLKGWNCRCAAQSAADPSATPGPVVALEVTRAWPTAASVRWCAPDSALSVFLVWVLRGDGSVMSNSSVSSRTRRTDVFGLAAGGHAYSVCVSVRNVAGALSHKRCVPVTTTNDAEAIAVYVLSGVSGVLLLAVAVLSLCLCRQCERRRGQALCGEPAHLNPVAHAFHDPHLTCSTVSIANPAYAPADEQAASAHCAHRAPANKSPNVR